MLGLIVVAAVALIMVGAFAGLLAEAGQVDVLAALKNPRTRAIIGFTLWQAGLSTLLSVVLAVPLARALARRGRFFGRRLLIRISSISLIIPSMVVVLGMVAVHGRRGWVNQALEGLGAGRLDYLYGLGGILLAHVFFNLPLATRIFLNGLLTLPQHSWNLAALYGLAPRHIFWRIEWPLLRGLMPAVCGMIFLLCFTSFAIVLTLGGGPKSTTLEVAIYQAVRFDFDLNKAAALALIQLAICASLGVAFFAGGGVFPLRAGDFAGLERPDSTARRPKFIDAAVITVAAIFLLSPLAAALGKALAPSGWSILMAADFWRATRQTLFIALCAGALSCVAAVAVADAIVTVQRSGWRRAAGGVEIIGALTLMAPPITLGTGLFVFFRNTVEHGDALSLGPLLVILLNALLALAFGIRIVVPALRAQRARYDDLCAALGISGWNRWRRILWPALRQPITYALAIATTLSAGDMGVIALFGTDNLTTLPLLTHRLLGGYRLEQAAVTAVALCLLCFALFWFIERLGGRDSAAKSPSESGIKPRSSHRHA